MHESLFRTGSRIVGSALADAVALFLLSVCPLLVAKDVGGFCPKYSLEALHSAAASIADPWIKNPVMHTKDKKPGN